MKNSRTILMEKIGRGMLYILCFAIPFSIAAIEIAFPISLIAWLAGWQAWKGNSRSVWATNEGQPILRPLLAFAAICAWSVSFSNYPLTSLEGLIYKTFEYILFFLILADVSNHPETAKRVVQLLLVASLFVVAHGLIQEWAILHFSGPGVPLDPIRGKPLIYERMVGPYSNPIDMATFLMVVSLAIIPSLMHQPLRRQAAGWPLWLMLIGSISWTESKGAMLGLASGILFLLLLNFKNKRMWLIAGTSLVVSLFVFVVFKQKNLLKTIGFADPGSQERIIMWAAALEMIKARPITGHGLNTFMANYMSYVSGPNQGPAYAHNCFFQIAAETGVISLFCFLLFLVRLFRECLKSLRKHLLDTETGLPLMGLLSGLLAFLVQSAFDTNLYSLRQAVLFWCLAGIIFGSSQFLLKKPAGGIT